MFSMETKMLQKSGKILTAYCLLIHQSMVLIHLAIRWRIEDEEANAEGMSQSIHQPFVVLTLLAIKRKTDNWCLLDSGESQIPSAVKTLFIDQIR